MQFLRRLAFAVLVAGVSSVANCAESPDFSRDIRPILSDKCFKCHGPDSDAREADLRLDRSDHAAEVLSRDHPVMSELLERVTSSDPDILMPPPGSKLSLTAAERRLLSGWVMAGAPWKEHWSFQSVQRSDPPELHGDTWSRTMIDRFILHRLRQEKVRPTAVAAKERLIRRLSFDLTGLPPTLEEIDAFLTDDAEDAWEKLIDRLLAKEAYGERMTSDWLDVARYADSFGFQVDRERRVWPWRDWVINAFNRNMSYDEFVTWQLAGDLLPDASDEQILATTFNRLHSQKVEGGSVPEEFRTEYVADRAHTFATAFLGLTLECCRCHDHKYDPVTQKEYYQLFAFFNSIDESGLYSYFTQSVPTPTLLLASDDQKAKIADVESRIAAAEKRLATIDNEVDGFREWLASLPEGAAEDDGSYDLEKLIPGQVLHETFENHKGGANASVPGKVGKAIRLSGDDAFGLKVGNFKRFEPFTVALWMNTPDHKERAVVFHRSRAWTDAGSRGYQLLIEDGRLSASLIHFWPGNAIRIRAKQPIATDEWLHVSLTYDGSSRASGLAIVVNGRPVECDVVRDNLSKNITGGGGDNIAIGQRFRDRGFTNGLVDEFRVFNRRLSQMELAQIYNGKSLLTALQSVADGQNDQASIRRLTEYYLFAVSPTRRMQVDALRKLREERSRLTDPISEIMVMRELASARPTYRLNRGAYDAPAERVEPDTPRLFPVMDADAPKNRLGLAKWLTDSQNPLTARVAVNHYWQLIFGAGLVRTPEDFGSQGQPPTHPELLDWLAADFVASGWDVKRLLKQIVMSATYRQDSQLTAELLQGDPENRLLARSPRYRLPAEMIRDNALAVSGLLVSKIGGPPVRPYEVAVSFKPVKRDEGEGLYRRSLYTFWKRTAPAPVMMSLDASKREVCVVKRERTSSPLQALVLLNDPQLVEAARALAPKLLSKHAGDLSASLTAAYRLLTSTRPNDREIEILNRYFAEQVEHFEKDEEAAAKLVGKVEKGFEGIPQPNIAAMTVVTATLMNLDRCLVKR